jgi:riboflavin synthase
MFTGIITDLGKVHSRTEKPGGGGLAGVRLTVETAYNDLAPGESVAVNGACLTVENFDEAGRPRFFLSPETLKLTAAQTLHEGSAVNLERALKASDRLSGHIVQGHVDGVGRIASVTRQGSGADACYALKVEIPEHLARHCVPKGSIALDGVSLTVNAIEGRVVDLMLIPHTWAHTAFQNSKAGDPINVETDILAKHMERLCTPYKK